MGSNSNLSISKIKQAIDRKSIKSKYYWFFKKKKKKKKMPKPQKNIKTKKTKYYCFLKKKKKKKRSKSTTKCNKKAMKLQDCSG